MPSDALTGSPANLPALNKLAKPALTWFTAGKLAASLRQLVSRQPLRQLALAGTVALAAVGQSHAADITGAGATFPYPLYAKWASEYKKNTGLGLNYQSIGSGGGIKQIQAKTVDFGASDMPLKPEDLAKSGLMQFPAIVGGVVPVLNVPGIESGKLKLSGALLADIYLGKIKRWNDPELLKLNAGLALPDLDITVVERSDGSGTTFLFTHFLGGVSADWASKVGVNTSVSWPVGIGGKGNEGVANYVKTVKGSIGYVEYAYAKENKIPYALLQNKDGKFIAPTAESFDSAADRADWSKATDFYLILTNQPGEKSWPITGASFILMHTVQQNPERGKDVLKFYDWALNKGQKLAEELAYVPLPDSLVKQVAAAWKTKLKDEAGKPIWP